MSPPTGFFGMPLGNQIVAPHAMQSAPVQVALAPAQQSMHSAFVQSAQATVQQSAPVGSSTAALQALPAARPRRTRGHARTPASQHRLDDKNRSQDHLRGVQYLFGDMFGLKGWTPKGNLSPDQHFGLSLAANHRPATKQMCDDYAKQLNVRIDWTHNPAQVTDTAGHVWYWQRSHNLAKGSRQCIRNCPACQRPTATQTVPPTQDASTALGNFASVSAPPTAAPSQQQLADYGFGSSVYPSNGFMPMEQQQQQQSIDPALQSVQSSMAPTFTAPVQTQMEYGQAISDLSTQVHGSSGNQWESFELPNDDQWRIVPDNGSSAAAFLDAGMMTSSAVSNPGTQVPELSGTQWDGSVPPAGTQYVTVDSPEWYELLKFSGPPLIDGEATYDVPDTLDEMLEQQRKRKTDW